MPKLVYASSLVAGTPEDVNTVQTMFDQVRNVINALDETNLAAGAQLPYAALDLTGKLVNADVKSDAAIAIAKLQHGAAGQLPVGQGGSNIWRDIYGHVEINSAGQTTIQPSSIVASMIQGDAVGSSEIAADAVGNSEVAPGAVDTGELALGAVTGSRAQLETLSDENAGTAIGTSYGNHAAVTLPAGLWLVMASAHLQAAGAQLCYSRLLYAGSIPLLERMLYPQAGLDNVNPSWVKIFSGGDTVSVQHKRDSSANDVSAKTELVAVRIGYDGTP